MNEPNPEKWIDQNRERLQREGEKLYHQFYGSCQYPPHLAFVVSEALKLWPDISDTTGKNADKPLRQFGLILMCEIVKEMTIDERDAFWSSIKSNVDNMRLNDLFELE